MSALGLLQESLSLILRFKKNGLIVMANNSSYSSNNNGPGNGSPFLYNFLVLDLTHWMRQYV